MILSCAHVNKVLDWFTFFNLALFSAWRQVTRRPCWWSKQQWLASSSSFFFAEFAWKKSSFPEERNAFEICQYLQTSNFMVPKMASCCISFKYWFFSNKYDYKQLLFYMYTTDIAILGKRFLPRYWNIIVEWFTEMRTFLNSDVFNTRYHFL